MYLERQSNEKQKKEGRAPGKPPEENGYIPPKRWNGETVKNPKGGGFEWPARDGRIWVPTGENGHRCPHWDVQDPQTGLHENVLPKR